jgi:exonuclease SbcD
MLELRGRYEELMRRSFYENTNYQEDYVHITLTDEEDVPEAMGRLRVVYRNLMKLSYDNTRTRHASQIDGAEDLDTKSPMDVFSEFYEKQNGTGLSEEQESFLKILIDKIWEDEA